VSGGSTDAGSADKFDLLFDGNQSPLRIWGTGYVVATPLEPDNLAPAWVTPGPAVIASPAGQSPIFVVSGRNSFDVSKTVYHDTGNAGFGGIIASNQFFAINFSRNVYRDGVLIFDSTIYVNFCIFRNIG
jgi:hypothetical protein